MANLRNRFPARRRFLKQSAALTAGASLAAPVLALASDPAETGVQAAPASPGSQGLPTDLPTTPPARAAGLAPAGTTAPPTGTSRLTLRRR